MNGDELAARIEAVRDHPDAWGEPAPSTRRKPKSERRRRAVMVSVRFTPAEFGAMSKAAAGGTLSGFIREAALAAASRPQDLIEGSARAGRPKALRSSLTLARPGRTFSCPHLSIGNVESASCGQCGPLSAAA